MTTYLWNPPPVASLPVRGTDARLPVHRIFCVGRNYAAHAIEMGRPVDKSVEVPFYFTKSPSTLVESGATIAYPPRTANYHHEMELVVVIGKPGFRVAEADAAALIWGYACGLDMTRRDLQLALRDKGRPWDIAKDIEQGAVISELVAMPGVVIASGEIALEVNGNELTLKPLSGDIPAGQALYQSVLTQDPFGGSTQFVGLENFERLFGDETYLASFQTTAFFSVLVAVCGLSISLLLAVMANRVLRGAGIYKTLLIWPYAVAPVVAGVLWLFMFASPMGVIAYWLRAIGIDWNHLLNSNHAMALIVVAAVWKQISYNFLFFLAGLQSIPKSLIEAAAIDGASPWRRFWTIVFPLLSPTTFFLLVINVVYAFFDTFGIVDATTKGGPGKDTAILVYKVYYDGFKALDMGGSAAQSVVLMTIVIALTVLQFRFVEKKVQY